MVPVHYISVVNGMTGTELARIEMPNKSYREKEGLYNTWHYRNHNGHFGIAYLDGVRPSLIFEYSNRNADKSFNGFVTAWDYRDGVLTERFNWVNRNEGNQYNDFHQIRIADVDGDGFDEMIEGGFVLDHTGQPLFGTELCHGDRHRTTDIDPDRPGLETFAIQQNNPTTLGMALYDAATGEMIKKWYMSGVGDVGRGECIDMDETSRGLEMYSTMYGYYDAKGNLLVDSSTDFPAEPLWWDGDLGREVLAPIGSDGANIDIKKWNSVTKKMDRYMYNNKPLYHEKSSYYTKAQYGGRPAFMGDLLGDWREELVLMRCDSTGFCIISTWDVTEHRIYCLMQNPGYRMQATTKGYYQGPYTDYYLAYDMPAPPVPPVMQSDMYWTGADGAVWQSGSPAFANGQTGAPASYADGKEVMFDLRGVTADTMHVQLTGALAPKKLWMMNPRGTTCELAGAGVLTGPMPVVKSQQGTVILRGAHTYTGQTRISEGRFVVDGTLESQVRVQARGTLAGIATLRGGILLEEGLNVEGGRLEPGFGTGASELGTLTIAGDVTAGGRNTFAFDISSSSDRRNDSIVVQGRLTITGTDNTILLQYVPGSLAAGTYTLLEAKGGLQASASQFTVQGLDGIPYELQTDGRFLRISVEEPRLPSTVRWMGTIDNVWDMRTKNFLVGQTQTVFAPQDSVYLTDAALSKSIVLSGTLPMRLLQMDAESDYTLSGSGVLSGIGGLRKNGQHTLTIEGTAHTYTGRTEVLGGTLEVAQLSVAGSPSSIGAASGEDGTVLLQNAILRIMRESTTDRSLSLIGENQIDIPTRTVYANLSGAITGSGRLIKTGAGQLTLSGRNTHTGGTVLREGTILLGTYEANMDAFPTGITIENGTVNMFGINNMSYTGPAAWDICVPAGGEAVLRVPDRFNMTGALTGEGHLTLLIPYVRAEMAGDWSAFTGILEIGGATGEFRLRNEKGLPGATVNLTGSAMLHYPTAAPSGEVPVGMLTGPATSSLQGASSRTITWAVGGNGQDGTFEGTISKTLRIVKRGAGTWTLTGNNTYTETTQVAEGRLLVMNTAGSATGTGSVSVAQGAVLGGTGTIAGAVSVAGMLQPGRDDVGTLNFDSDVTFVSTGIYAVEVRKTSSAIRCDKLQAAGRVTWNGTLQLTLLSGTYAAGDVLTIAGAASFSGQPTVIQPAVPADGLLWDLADINTGVIRVVTDPAVDRVVIITQPAAPAQKLCAGASHTMQVTASGNNLRYQWSLNASPVSGAIRSSYTTDAPGVYTVKVYNANDAVFSDEVLLEVSSLKSVTLSGQYSRLTASVTAPSDGYAYRWMCVRPASDAASAALRSAGWTLQEGVLSKTSGDAQCMVPASGTYRVEVTDLQSQCKTQSAGTVTLSQVTGLPETLAARPTFYPNPVRDILHVDLPLSGGTVEICDMAGNRLLIWQKPSGSQELPVGDLPAGTYLLRIVTADGVQAGKFVKEL